MEASDDDYYFERDASKEVNTSTPTHTKGDAESASSARFERRYFSRYRVREAEISHASYMKVQCTQMALCK